MFSSTQGMQIQSECPQFLTDDGWKMPLLLALHPHVAAPKPSIPKSILVPVQLISWHMPLQLGMLLGWCQPKSFHGSHLFWKIMALEEDLTVFHHNGCRPQFGQIPFTVNAEYGRVTQHRHYHSQFTANLQIYTNTSQQDPHSAFLPYQIAVENRISETGLSSPVIHSIKKISKPGISRLFLKRSESKFFQAVGPIRSAPTIHLCSINLLLYRISSYR